MLPVVAQDFVYLCLYHVGNFVGLHVFVFFIRNRRKIEDLGADMSEPDVVEYFPGVYKSNRYDGAFCHQCGLKASGLEVLQIVAVIVVAAFREDEKAFAVLYAVSHFFDNADGLTDIVNLERKAVAECKNLLQDRHVGLPLINDKRAALFVGVHNTAGVVFSLMIREHDVAAFRRKVLRSVGFGEDAAVYFDEADNITYDGITLLRRIFLFVPDDIAHTEQIVDLVKQTDYYNIVKSKHMPESFHVCVEPIWTEPVAFRR